MAQTDSASSKTGRPLMDLLTTLRSCDDGDGSGGGEDGAASARKTSIEAVSALPDSQASVGVENLKPFPIEADVSTGLPVFVNGTATDVTETMGDEEEDSFESHAGSFNASLMISQELRTRSAMSATKASTRTSSIASRTDSCASGHRAQLLHPLNDFLADPPTPVRRTPLGGPRHPPQTLEALLAWRHEIHRPHLEGSQGWLASPKTREDHNSGVGGGPGSPSRYVPATHAHSRQSSDSWRTDSNPVSPYLAKESGKRPPHTSVPSGFRLPHVRLSTSTPLRLHDSAASSPHTPKRRVPPLGVRHITPAVAHSLTSETEVHPALRYLFLVCVIALAFVVALEAPLLLGGL